MKPVFSKDPVCEVLAFKQIRAYYSQYGKSNHEKKMITCYISTVSFSDFKLVQLAIHVIVKSFSKQFADKSRITTICS